MNNAFLGFKVLNIFFGFKTIPKKLITSSMRSIKSPVLIKKNLPDRDLKSISDRISSSRGSQHCIIRDPESISDRVSSSLYISAKTSPDPN